MEPFYLCRWSILIQIFDLFRIRSGAAQEDKVARSLNLAVQGETLAGLDNLNTRQDRERISTYQTIHYYHALISIPLQHLIN